MNTYAEENYIKAIYQLSERLEENISTNALAEEMRTSAASVTDMLKKLAVKKLISYRRYKGFKLTAKGNRLALNVIRKHRLWELFLVDTLKFSWDEVHDVAEQLEHIKSPKLVDRLDAFLKFPSTDPHGDPIPDEALVFRAKRARRLSELDHAQTLQISGVADHSPMFMQFMAKHELSMGGVIHIEERNSYDASLRIKTGNNKVVFISALAAHNILATPRHVSKKRA